ncbi:MAG: hypothetical protein JXB03_01400 [Spirochaetales bacterium]|nr:hypothetical protein [Spirochaetales bacterium]
MYCYHLQIGSAVCGIRVKSSRLFTWCEDYFMAPSVPAAPDMLIDLRLARYSSVGMVPDSFFQSKELSGRTFRMKGGLIQGRLHSRTHGGAMRVSLKVHPVMIETDVSRVFEQCLYQAYFSILGQKGAYAPLIHSSGVIKDGKGYLFLGPSEAGKSTVAALSSAYQVINDEITIADISGRLPMLVSTLFNGLFRAKHPGSAPLAGIFVLHKSSRDRMELLSGSSAVRPVADQIIPPLGLDAQMTAHTYFSQLDIAAALQERVPVYKLEFTKSVQFWHTISRGIL